MQDRKEAVVPNRSLPVLQGYWRLLEPKTDRIQEHDETCSPDYREFRWIQVPACWIDTTPDDGGPPIRRRVPPPPTCGTCEYFDPKLKYFTDICGHGEGLHSCNPDGSDYCSKHPEAQEANR